MDIKSIGNDQLICIMKNSKDEYSAMSEIRRHRNQSVVQEIVPYTSWITNHFNLMIGRM